MIFRTMSRVVALLFLASAVLFAAPSAPKTPKSYVAPKKLPGSNVIPPNRLADWTPGVTVGVPGGIPTDRTHLIDVTKDPYNADNTGANDAQPAIVKAIADAKDKDVVYLPAGKYRINTTFGPGTKQITIRGAGPDKTILMAYNKVYSTISLGASGGADWSWSSPQASITGSPKKGATVLTADMNALVNTPVGALCQIALKNDLTLPVWSHSNWNYLRRQKVRITEKTATTITIFPPLLFDLPSELEPKLNAAARHAEFSGVEDLTVDGTNAEAPNGLIGMGQCYGCWVKNVVVKNCARYCFGVGDSLQCEIRHSFIGHRKQPFGPNGGGILFGGVSSCLVEDNIVAVTFPHMEIDASSGNVFAYNFCDDTGIQGDILGCTINANHGPHSNFNLYEGNYAPKFQSDGYHGSASHDTLYRNWFHGSSTHTNNFWICINLNRFARDYNLVGNVLGRKGATWIYDNCNADFGGFGYQQHFIFMFGMPNMGNGAFSGKAQISKGKYPADWKTLLASPMGKGPGSGGFQELDLDVRATALVKGNFNYADNGVNKSESLGSAKLPASLYLKAKPAWFGNLAWPPFGPDTEFEKHQLPAQVRYEEMSK